MLLRRSGRALALAAGLLLCAAASQAQTAPAAPAPPADDPRIKQLELQLDAQRQAFEVQRAQLEERIQKVETQAATAQAEAAEAKSQVEVAALMGSGQEEEAEMMSEPAVRVYGFADVGLQRAWGSIAEIIPGGTNKATFV